MIGGLAQLLGQMGQMPQSYQNTSGIAGAAGTLPPAMQQLAMAPPPMPGQGFDSLGSFSQQALGLAGISPGMGPDLKRTATRLPYPLPGGGGAHEYSPPDLMGGGRGGMGGLGAMSGLNQLLSAYRMGLLRPQPQVPPNFLGY